MLISVTYQLCNVLFHITHMHTLYSRWQELSFATLCICCTQTCLPAGTVICHNMLTGRNCHLPQYAYRQELSSATLHTYPHLMFTGRNCYLPHYVYVHKYAYWQELSSATLHTYPHFMFTGRNCHLPHYVYAHKYAYRQELSSATLHTYAHFMFTGRNHHLPY